MSAVTGKVEKSQRLSSYLGAEKQSFPMSEGEPGAVSDPGMGSGPTDGAQPHSSKGRLVWQYIVLVVL